MAKVSVIERNKKKYELWEKHKAKRKELRKVVNDPDTSLEEKMQAQEKFAKLGRASCSTQLRRRCKLTGRGRGVYRMTGLCRNMMRKHLMNGLFPGAKKASW